MQKIKVKEIYLDEEFNSRDEIQFSSVVTLAKSIEKDGLIQPIMVREMPEENGKKYKVIAGHRRTKAHLILCNNDSKFELIDAIIRNDVDETQARVMNLNENLARKSLNIMEEAMALKPLFKLGLTEDQIVKELPTASRGWVQVRCLLLKLPKEIQAEAAAGLITQTHIRELYTLQYAGATHDRLFEEVRHAKTAKARGIAYKIRKTDKKQQSPSEIRHTRKRTEIFIMIQHLLENKMAGLATRTLAWAAGEVTDLDLFLDLRDHAEEEDLEYIIPRQGLDYGVKT